MNPARVTRLARVLILGGCGLLAACKPGGKSDAIPRAAADDFLKLPGDYSQKTTVADLEQRFGKSNVRQETGPEPRLVLFPDDPARRAYVTFHEAAAFRKLANISVVDAGSLWRGKHGVHVGMAFSELRKLNGKPFYYSGFDGQHRGWVHDGWSPSLGDDDATLGAFDTDENDHLYFDVELGVRDLKAASGLPAADHLSSDDPRFPDLGGKVVVTGFSASSSLDDEWE